MKDLILITPPFTQLNTPYPATAYLKGFLNTKNITAFQSDLGIEVINKMFSKSGLTAIFLEAERQNRIKSINTARIYALRSIYIAIIDEVVLFLQGNNDTLARQICTDNYLPQASRFEQLDDMEWAFGSMGLQDKAKHLATLFLEDISDFIKECVDEHFGFSRYAERLGRSANSFDELYDILKKPARYIDKITLPLLDNILCENPTKLVCFSAPFPGNLYSAFRCAQYIKSHFPSVKTALGGGFANTELRSINDERVFAFFDFITLDDGELPIELLISNVNEPYDTNPNYGFFKRTFLLEKNQVIYNNHSLRQDYKQKDLGTPDYSDLFLNRYISVIEIANPMHSLWSDGRWNKLTMAHGCYWGKCTFCDISLDYIKLYEPIAAGILADRMEELIRETGERGFHFVDEAAPPALMRSLAMEILKRKLKVTWWTNIRFEKSFTHDLCRLLQASGCIAVSGGLEVASNRLLELIQKGVTVEQVAQVTRNFTASGIMVHSYLMYAYPTQTVQETVDSLEMVRQLFEQGIIQSGFWHQFALTAHSPVGLDPENYGITPVRKEIKFANNDVEFTDSTGINHNKFSYGLKKSLFNFMHGLCFDYDLQEWFDFKIPKTTIKSDFIAKSLETDDRYEVKSTSKLLWIGPSPVISEDAGEVTIELFDRRSDVEIPMDKDLGHWLVSFIECIDANGGDPLTYEKMRESFEKEFEDFTMFWFSEELETLREFGLLVL